MFGKRILSLLSALMVGLVLLSACTPTVKKTHISRPHDSYAGLGNGERNIITGTVAGLFAGGVKHTAMPHLAIAGAVLGAGISGTPTGLTKRLHKSSIEVVHYGDNIRVIIPSDEIFVFNTAKINYRYYTAMNDVVRLMRFYNGNDITVAAYNDDVDRSKQHLMLSDNRAQAVRAYLWSHGIDAHYTHAVGMGSNLPSADNYSVRGQHYNRRVEITVRSPEWNSFV